MSKKKIFSSVLVFALALTLALVGFAWLGFTRASNAFVADDVVGATHETVDQQITVEVKQRLNPVADLDPEQEESQLETFDNVKLSYYKWEKASKFVIKANTEQIVDVADGGKWNYSISMQFIRKRPTDGGTFEGASDEEGGGFVVQEIQASTSVNALTEIGEHEYYIDLDDVEGHISNDLGWGIYRFVLTVNDSEYYSQLYYIEPNTIVTSNAENFKVTWTPVEHPSSFGGDFLFTLDVGDPYVDQSVIRWYVDGEVNGEKYVYHAKDTSTYTMVTPDRPDYFVRSEYSHSLTQATESRVSGSTTFLLNTRGYKGTWKVFCVIYNGTPKADSSNLSQLTPLWNTKATAVEVETLDEYNAFNIIWIIVACAAVLVIGLVVVIVLSVRKEKVW